MYGQPRPTVLHAPIMAKISNGVYVKSTANRTDQEEDSRGSLGQTFHIRRNLTPANSTARPGFAQAQPSAASRIRRSSRRSNAAFLSPGWPPPGDFFLHEPPHETLHVARSGGVRVQAVI